VVVARTANVPSSRAVDSVGIVRVRIELPDTERRAQTIVTASPIPSVSSRMIVSPSYRLLFCAERAGATLTVTATPPNLTDIAFAIDVLGFYASWRL